MATTINKLSDVEYELEIEATADDLAPGIATALKRQRANASMKGFRPGKVPAGLVKKMYGKAIAYGVAEDHVQSQYKETILESGDFEVLGQPTITDLDYEYEGDLKAKVRFGVRPVFDLASVEDATVSKLAHEVGDDEVDEEIDRFRERSAELVPVEGAADEESFVLTDLQAIDEESGTPTIGEKRDDVAFYLGSEDLPEASVKALVGASVGDTVRVTLVANDTEEEAPFDATIKEIKRRELPEIDEEFVKEVSKGNIETVEDFRADLKKRMQRSVEQTSRELFEGALIHEVLEAHDFEVPEAVVDLYVEQQLKSLKQEAKDKLPQDFDEEAWKQGARGDAERQAKWMFIRDRAVEIHELEVTDEDRDAFFERTGDADGLQPELLKQYYRSMGQLSNQLNERLLTEKVIDHFAQQATVVEKDREAFQAEAREHDHDHDDHDHDHGDHDDADHDHAGKAGKD